MLLVGLAGDASLDVGRPSGRVHAADVGRGSGRHDAGAGLPMGRNTRRSWSAFRRMRCASADLGIATRARSSSTSSNCAGTDASRPSSARSRADSAALAVRFAVDDVHVVGSLGEFVDPSDQVVGVGMDRHRRQLRDGASNGDVASVHPDVVTRRRPVTDLCVPAAWKPHRMTALRGSGSRRARWCRTRPPVAMPDAEMMIAGPMWSAIAIDCSTDRHSRSPPPGSKSMLVAEFGAVHVEDGQRHRAVGEDRQRRDPLVAHQSLEEQEQEFSAIDGERRDDDAAAPCRSPADRLGDRLLVVIGGAVDRVAVGRLDQHRARLPAASPVRGAAGGRHARDRR